MILHGVVSIEFYDQSHFTEGKTITINLLGKDEELAKEKSGEHQRKVDEIRRERVDLDTTPSNRN